MDRGVTSFGTNKKLTMAIVVMFTALSLILFIVAMAGWSTDANNLKSAAWAFSTSEGGKTYIGLQGFSIDVSTTIGSGTGYFSYSDCPTGITFCSGCQNGGRAALGLTLLSFFLTMGVFVLSLLRMFKDTSGTKICSVVFLFFIWLFAVAGWGAWNTQCFSALTDSNLTFSHMGGFGAAVAGWFFMWGVGVIHLLTPVDDGSSGGSYGGGSGENTGENTGGQKMDDQSNA